MGEGTAEQVLPDSYIYYLVDIRTSEKGAFQDTMDDLVSRLHVHELDTIYNVTYLRALGIPYDEEAADTEVSDQGFPFLTVAGLLAGTLVLLAAGLVIYNILKIAVSKRIRQFGTLRAMGGEKGQLYAIVTTEILLLCIGGIPAGMLLGMFSAEGILSAAAGMLSPDTFFSERYRTAETADCRKQRRERPFPCAERRYHFRLCFDCGPACRPVGCECATCRGDIPYRYQSQAQRTEGETDQEL